MLEVGEEMGIAILPNEEAIALLGPGSYEGALAFYADGVLVDSRQVHLNIESGAGNLGY
jgi:hypothetical protein